MAITYYTGIPRSGKSYKAVYYIYDLFLAPKKYEKTILDKSLEKLNLRNETKNPFEVCYTNLNKFAYHLDDRFKPFNFDIFFVHLVQLHTIYKDDTKNDDDLIEYCKEHNLFNALFVIDEAHNILTKKNASNEVLIWWFTYHGHLFHEIILITQHLSLIPAEFTKYTEYFYKAIPQRFRLSKNTFKYIEYSGVQMFKTQKLGIVSVPAKKEVFEMYVSGAEKKDKPIIYKYILLLIFVISIALFSFFRFTSSINEDIKTEPTQIEENENIQDIKQIEPIKTPSLSKEKSLFRFTCFNENCYYSSSSSFYEIPITILNKFIEDLEPNEYIINYRDERLIIYLFALNDDFAFLKPQTNTNQQKNNNFNLIR
jgi:zona occludens toxin